MHSKFYIKGIHISQLIVFKLHFFIFKKNFNHIKRLLNSFGFPPDNFITLEIPNINIPNINILIRTPND